MRSKRKPARGGLFHLVLYTFIATFLFLFPVTSSAQDKKQGNEPEVYSLRASINRALRMNTQILSAEKAVAAAQESKKQQFTEFLPKASARYGYTRLDEDKWTASILTRHKEKYQFTATIDQPVFDGFTRKNQYDISKLNLEMEQVNEKQTKQDIILRVKEIYFELLQNQKLKMVAQQAVKQLEAHVRVARDFYDVGMIPRNDVLEAEVNLANARQNLVIANHRVLVTMSRLNTLLRRPVSTPLNIEDVLTYKPFTLSYEEAVETSKRYRTEIQLADMEVNRAEKDIDLAKTGYYPSIDLQGNYYRYGDDCTLDGGDGITDRDEWDVMATLSWTFWEWGKTRHSVNEKRRRLEQTKLFKTTTEDNIFQEVKEAYLRVKGSESNILTAEKAVEQAKENFRISEERYKEQVATSTDVLDAQTLLTETENNYFNALSSFNISKAMLDRAMGLGVIP